MEILEKLLDSGATVDFQDRVSERAGIQWETGGGSSIDRHPLPATCANLKHKQVAQVPDPTSVSHVTLSKPLLLPKHPL